MTYIYITFTYICIHLHTLAWPPKYGPRYPQKRKRKDPAPRTKRVDPRRQAGGDQNVLNPRRSAYDARVGYFEATSAQNRSNNQQKSNYLHTLNFSNTNQNVQLRRNLGATKIYKGGRGVEGAPPPFISADPLRGRRRVRVFRSSYRRCTSCRRHRPRSVQLRAEIIGWTGWRILPRQVGQGKPGTESRDRILERIFKDV